MADGVKVGSIYYDVDLNDGKFQSGADNVSNRLNGLQGAFLAAERGSMIFAGALAAVGAAGIAATGFGVKMAADIETMKQGFVTLLGTTQKADDAIKMIQKDAASTPFEFAGLVKANQLLTSVTGDAGRSEKLLLNIGKGLTAMGRSGADLDRVIFNIQQIANTGKITEMDIRQFGNSGINILDLLASSYGVTKEKAGEMVKDSKDAFGDLEKAFEKAGTGSGKFARAFELQGGTFNQVLSNFKDNIAITASEFVKQTGIFDLVKDALSRVTDALSNLAKPETIQAIIQFFQQLQPFLPIITGLIIGGLVPAFVALAASMWAAFAPLIPFLAVGALVGAAVMLIVNAFGGWNVVLANLQAAWNVFMVLFDTFIRPALEYLWNLILTQLVPALQQLWNVIAPVLVPVLQFLGAVLVGIVFVAIMAVIGVLILIIKWVVDWVNKVTWGIEMIKALFTALKEHVTKTVQEKIDFVMKLFNSLPGWVQSAISGLAHIITKPFEDAWNAIKGILDKIKNGINDALNPSVRHSPSLIDNVTKGVGTIIDQYSRLADIALPDFMSGTPNFAMAGTGDTSPQIINIYVDKIADNQDINAIGREIGFRAGLQPR